MALQIIEVTIKIRARDTMGYNRTDSWTARHNARRAFLDELMDEVEDHAKNNHLVIFETTTTHKHEEDYDG